MDSELTTTKPTISVWAFVLSGLAFIPLLGIPFGLVAIIWGLVSRNKKSKLVAGLGCLGILFTILVYGLFFYFGFVQRGGMYDKLRLQLAESNLKQLVQVIEFYKVENGHYPQDLTVFNDNKASKNVDFNATLIIDPTQILDPMRQNVKSPSGAFFYYQLIDHKKAYYLLGVGPDGKPFTADDILPNIQPNAHIGFRIHP